MTTCAYCSQAGRKMCDEHVVPRSRGGPDRIDNIVRACMSCNASKSSRTPSEWRIGLAPFIYDIERKIVAEVGPLLDAAPSGRPPTLCGPKPYAQAPSETYAARAARGRPVVAYSLAASVRDRVAHLATEMGVSRGEVIERAVAALDRERAGE